VDSVLVELQQLILPSGYALVTTTIRLRFSGRSTGVRLLINGHSDVTRYSCSHAGLFIYLDLSAAA